MHRSADRVAARGRRDRRRTDATACHSPHPLFGHLVGERAVALLSAERDPSSAANHRRRPRVGAPGPYAGQLGATLIRLRAGISTLVAPGTGVGTLAGVIAADTRDAVQLAANVCAPLEAPTRHEPHQLPTSRQPASLLPSSGRSGCPTPG